MSDYLIDTNVISESARPKPVARVDRWLKERERLYVSSVTWFELRRGVESLPRSRRREALEAWLAAWITSGLEVLPFDQDAAAEAARIEVAARSRGRGIEIRDLFVLATAAASGLGVATRNVSHFSGFGPAVLDPFTETE
jgi:predicted nucleic acid-binding protein